ncbi:MAG: hypothetical protein ACLFPE_07505 [Bacteroidales bacterium]
MIYNEIFSSGSFCSIHINKFLCYHYTHTKKHAIKKHPEAKPVADATENFLKQNDVWI